MSRQEDRAQKRAVAKTARTSAKTSVQQIQSRSDVDSQNVVQALRELAPFLEKMSKKECRVAAREILEKYGGVSRPTRMEFPPTPDNDIAGDELIKNISPYVKGKGNGAWISPLHFKTYSKTGKPRKRGNCKTQCKKFKWSCGCPKWKKHRTEDCQHIRRVKRKEKISNIPFSTARRRPPTVIVMPEGMPSEETCRKNAYLEMPERVPEFMLELVETAIPEPDHTTSGSIGVPQGVAAYGLFRKVFDDTTYAKMICNLKKEDIIWNLGWAKDKPPSESAWVRKNGQSILTPSLWEAFRRTVRKGRLMDWIALMDADDTPTVRVANSCDRKFGPPEPAFRKAHEMIRRHLFVGDISRLILAAHVTLDHGLGSNEGAHYMSLLREVLSVAEYIRKSTADKAYESAAIFAEAEMHGIDHYVPAKTPEDYRQGDQWSESARRLGKLQRDKSAIFQNITRKREGVEGTIGACKSNNPHQRLHRRKTDPTTVYSERVSELMRIFGDGLKVRISELPEDVLAEIFDVATTEVGIARLNEALMIMIVYNLRRLVMLEHLTGVKITFKDDEPLPPLEIYTPDEEAA
jgi:hypothetical protein